MMMMMMILSEQYSFRLVLFRLFWLNSFKMGCCFSILLVLGGGGVAQ